MKSKIFVLLICVVMILGVVSCKKSSAPAKDNPVFQGYLMDVACGGVEIALDKSNTGLATQEQNEG